MIIKIISDSSQFFKKENDKKMIINLVQSNCRIWNPLFFLTTTLKKKNPAFLSVFADLTSRSASVVDEKKSTSLTNRYG